MDWVKVLTIIVSVGGVMVLQTNAMRAEADADRRALQASMDTFRQEMQRLAERQSRVEGQVAALADAQR